MSERAIDHNLTERSDEDLLREYQQRQKTRNDRKAKLASVLSRGVTMDRLTVDLPVDKVGEWVPNDKLEIARMESIGYEVDREYAKSRRLHSAGDDGSSVVGDVIFMITPRENKELIDEIRAENYRAINNPRGGKQKEERDFEALDNILPASTQSKIDSVEGRDILQTISQTSG